MKYRKHIRATDGGNGSYQHMKGADGIDEILEVPIGTIVRDEITGEQEHEITQDGEEIIIVKGGRGGLGNSQFKSATNQSPRHAQPGEPGKEEWKILELKLLADVGLVGFPNAGKSTLLSRVTHATPKIADYPFTTLEPQLGVVRISEGRSFVMADIPGLIEGASQGKGLGIKFLKHLERTKILLHLVELATLTTFVELEKRIKTIEYELKQHSPKFSPCKICRIKLAAGVPMKPLLRPLYQV